MNVTTSHAALNCCRTSRHPTAAANAAVPTIGTSTTQATLSDPNDCVSLLSLGRLAAVSRC
jgi:hypothetical protein